VAALDRQPRQDRGAAAQGRGGRTQTSELPDDDVSAIVGGTRGYLADFITGYRECANSRELVSYLRDRYPDHGNPSALVLSAVTAFKRKERTPA
jgi:hypothetical protein